MLGLLLVLVAGGLDVVLGLRQISLLTDAPPWDGPPPGVTLVTAARDEERGIEAAARSLLAQRYAALRFVMVDDRSADRTGAILDRLAAEDPRLTVIHVRELPPGWLGKNHALQRGAEAARGEWLLFADADVVMHPDTVARAVGFAERRGVDHLALLPDMAAGGFLMKAFITHFIIWLLAYLRPWKARDPKSRHAVGIGAFNLVRTRAYVAADGHESIRLRPDDDLKLGKVLKRTGARQDIVSGRDLVSVEWYRSVGEAIDGLMKNTFAVVEYRAVLAVLGALGYIALGVAPLAALVAGSGTLQLLGGAAVGVQLLLELVAAREAKAPPTVALIYPLMSLLLAWIVLRAVTVNLRAGGIVWRGTFYPLAELRRNKI